MQKPRKSRFRSGKKMKNYCKLQDTSVRPIRASISTHTLHIDPSVGECRGGRHSLYDRALDDGAICVV